MRRAAAASDGDADEWLAESRDEVTHAFADAARIDYQRGRAYLVAVATQRRGREQFFNALDDGDVRHAAPALQKANVQVFSLDLRIGANPAMALQLAVGIEHADFVLDCAERGVVGRLRQIEAHDVAARATLQEH